MPNVPDRPEIGYRAQNALIAHDEDVVIPSFATEKIHYEGELVVVIGKKAKHLTEADAMSCVFGYTIGNDVSERTWQKADRSLWRSKNADTFKPMGPWIETDVDLDKMETIIRVNGKETGRFRTNDMIFGVVPFIVELTKYFTLWPGDVIWMGTDGASPDLKAGDVVEIDITGIGTLRNRFVAEKVCARLPKPPSLRSAERALEGAARLVASPFETAAARAPQGEEMPPYSRFSYSILIPRPRSPCASALLAAEIAVELGRPPP